MLDVTSDRAELRAMLDVEAALARANAQAGLIAPEVAEMIAASCREELFDLALLQVADATPVVPLVRALTALVPEPARPYVHLGSTSQDIIDTALMLITRRALALIDDDLAKVAERLDALARTHIGTVQMGRTLLQQAMPTTFGVVCASWLVGLTDARVNLGRVRLAVQCGGPVGHPYQADVAEYLAAELGLEVPVAAWHTDRGRIVELGAALGQAIGALGKMAGDVILLSQNEIGELAEGEPGGSSAMPHKRNPARSVQICACAHRMPGLVATLFAGMPQELQRAAGRWQAEWPTVTTLLQLAGTAAEHSRELLSHLDVRTERMLANAAP